MASRKSPTLLWWQDQEATSDGHHSSQGGRISYSGRGYHDEQMTFHRIDNRLKTIEERTATIQGTLHNHVQWQATMGHEMVNLQQMTTATYGDSIPTFQHPATSLSYHANNQLGGEEPSYIQLNISFIFLRFTLLLISFLYIKKKYE